MGALIGRHGNGKQSMPDDAIANGCRIVSDGPANARIEYEEVWNGTDRPIILNVVWNDSRSAFVMLPEVDWNRRAGVFRHRIPNDTERRNGNATIAAGFDPANARTGGTGSGMGSARRMQTANGKLPLANDGYPFRALFMSRYTSSSIRSGMRAVLPSG
jgi:hypothetical protein